MTSRLPSNVNVSRHPCVRAKLSQFRSKSCSTRETKNLVHEIATIIGTEALFHALQTTTSGKDTTPLGFEYDIDTVYPAKISIVPVLRSGLGMLDAIESILPRPVPIHHLGLFRDPVTLQPVEYYNNLPSHDDPPSASASSSQHHLAIILDPVIATGGTAVAAVQTLRDWGASRILLLSVLASDEGVRRAAGEWPEGVEVWTAGIDAGIDAKGMIVPGVGDVGDRLFLTKGK